MYIKRDELPVIGDNMKFRGKAVSGTSFLMMFAVVLTATTIVAAAVLLSAITPMTGRDIADTTAMTITYGNADASKIVTVPATTNYDAWSTATTTGIYDQGVNVSSADWAGAYNLNIKVTSGAADIATTHISLKYAKLGDTAYTDISLVDYGASLDATIPGLTKAAGIDDQYIFIITVNYGAPNYVISMQAQTP